MVACSCVPSRLIRRTALEGQVTLSETRVPFYNKIFFCDIIGYSRLDAQGQYGCQRTLNRLLAGLLHELGCVLETDVIALPTGDGVVLNFLAPAPDVHLRTAARCAWLRSRTEKWHQAQNWPQLIRGHLGSRHKRQAERGRQRDQHGAARDGPG